MRVEDLDKPINNELPYDVPSDVHFHMLNDDSFYRKYYLPVMDKIRSERNNDVIQGLLNPMIDKCVNHYIIKYDIAKKPNELMSKDEKSSLANKVLDFEKNPQEARDAFTPDIRSTK